MNQTSEPKSVLEDYILNKIKNFTLVTLVQGETQVGKSTFVKYLLDNLSMYKFNCRWDYTKFCSKNLMEFVRMVKKYDNQLLVYEEAAKDISVDSWYDRYNHFFNVMLQTQGYKHNLIVLVFPSAMQISNRQKYFIKLGITIKEKVIEPETLTFASRFKPTIYFRDFWKLEEHDLRYRWWGRNHFVKYSEEDLKEAQEYTKWLEGMKENTMIDIELGMKELEMMEDLKRMRQDLRFSKIKQDWKTLEAERLAEEKEREGIPQWAIDWVAGKEPMSSTINEFQQKKEG